MEIQLLQDKVLDLVLRLLEMEVLLQDKVLVQELRLVEMETVLL